MYKKKREREGEKDPYVNLPGYQKGHLSHGFAPFSKKRGKGEIENKNNGRRRERIKAIRQGQGERWRKKRGQRLPA